MTHKENCPWKEGFSLLVTANNPGGGDEYISITDESIYYRSNYHTINDDDQYISFDFCPKCGASLTQED